MDLSVLIVNWNTGTLLKKCIQSIDRETNGVEYEVIVVDNASSDGSHHIEVGDFDNLKIIQSKENLGFGGGNNLAAKYASGEVLILLNPDTIVKDKALSKLYTVMQSEGRETGAIGPILLNEDLSLQRDQGNSFPNLWTAFSQYFFVSHITGLSSIFLNKRPSKMRELDWLCGACVCLRRDLFQEVGGFDEDYFLYAEDMDLCRRIKKSGYSIKIDPSIEIVHISKQSIQKQDPSVYRMQVSNLIKYYQNYHSSISLQFFKTILFVGFTLRIIVYSLLHVVKPKPQLKTKITGTLTLIKCIYG